MGVVSLGTAGQPGEDLAEDGQFINGGTHNDRSWKRLDLLASGKTGGCRVAWKSVIPLFDKVLGRMSMSLCVLKRRQF